MPVLFRALRSLEGKIGANGDVKGFGKIFDGKRKI